jgi:hypothetical protein
MKRRTILLSLLFFAQASCSGDDRPVAAGASSSSSSAGGGGPGGDGGGADGSGSGMTVPFPERLCDALPQRGEEILEWGQPESAPPGNGGAIKTGTYVLRVLDFYKGPQPPPDGGEAPVPTLTGNAARVTLYVQGNTFRFIEARGMSGALPAADTGRGFSYLVSGSSLAMTPQCPMMGPAKTIPFTVAGDQISLLVDPTHREVYVRQP